jgi:hypothetical protein
MRRFGRRLRRRGERPPAPAAAPPPPWAIAHGWFIEAMRDPKEGTKIPDGMGGGAARRGRPSPAAPDGEGQHREKVLNAGR